MPMIVMPHGGPFGIRDYWGFDPGTQLLASAAQSAPMLPVLFLIDVSCLIEI